MADIVLSPSIIAEINDLKDRVKVLELRRPMTGVAIPVVPLGANRPFGFCSLDVTTFSDCFRCDVMVTAPILDFDVQVTSDFGVGISTVEWRISGQDFTNDGPVLTIATGGGVNYTQDQGRVDLRPILGADVIFKYVRFDLEVKRTGGSGDAGVRLVRPLLLRLPTT